MKLQFLRFFLRVKKDNLAPEQIELLKKLREESDICRDLIDKSAKSKHPCATQENHTEVERCGLEYNDVIEDFKKHQAKKRELKVACAKAGIRRLLIDENS